VLHLTVGVAIGVDVADFLELEHAFKAVTNHLVAFNEYVACRPFTKAKSGRGRMITMAQKQWTADDIRRILSDPGYCLSVPPVIPEEQWIKAGVRLIDEIGAEAYLRLLLDHLLPA
jgi:hypothetical protein